MRKLWYVYVKVCVCVYVCRLVNILVCALYRESRPTWNDIKQFPNNDDDHDYDDLLVLGVMCTVMYNINYVHI